MNSTSWHDEADGTDRYLLQCVVEVAKAAFRARACSVFVVDDQTGELVFEAVAGEGQDHLVGSRFSAGTGIAGWVGASGQPLIADDLSGTTFSQEAASETGYVPTTIAAAPILHEGRCIGVLEVLDRDSMRDELETLELVGLLSAQAAAGIALLQQVRHSARYPTRPAEPPFGNAAVLEGIAADLYHLNDEEDELLSQVLALAGGISRRAALRQSPFRPTSTVARGTGRRAQPSREDQGS
jgi:signal transduction protein with GAF and PtsI domain